MALDENASPLNTLGSVIIKDGGYELVIGAFS